MIKTTGGNALLNAEFILDKAEVVQDKKIADLGCGASGHFVFPAAKRVGEKKGLVYAVDILKPILDNIERVAKLNKVDNIKTVWTDLEIFGAAKINSSSIDSVMLINTLYQSSKRVEILREAIRILKTKGILLVVEWKNNASPFGPPIDERVKAELLKTGAAKLGLNLIEEFDAGQYHYGLVFAKM